MNRASDVEAGNIHPDHIRQIARQAFDRERTQALLEQAAHVLDPVRDPLWFERNVSLDDFILRNCMKIHVEDGAPEWRVLHLLDKREPAFPGDLKLNQNVFAGCVTQQRVDVAP